MRAEYDEIGIPTRGMVNNYSARVALLHEHMRFETSTGEKLLSMRHQLLSPYEFFFLCLPEVSDLADICLWNQQEGFCNVQDTNLCARRKELP